MFADAPENLKALISGVAGCSPYLRNLLTREHDWLATVLDRDPDQVIADVLAAVDLQSPERLGKSLRLAKARVALYAALADIGGMWPLEKVTGTLTDLADFAVDKVLKSLSGSGTCA